MPSLTINTSIERARPLSSLHLAPPPNINTRGIRRPRLLATESINSPNYTRPHNTPVDGFNTDFSQFQDTSSLESASVDGPKSARELTYTSFQLSIPSTLQTSESLKKNYLIASTFKECFKQKLATLQNIALDSNGDPKAFDPFENSDETIPMDIADLHPTEDWPLAELWKQDLQEMVMDIEYLENFISRLNSVAPEGR